MLDVSLEEDEKCRAMACDLWVATVLGKELEPVEEASFEDF